MSGLSDRDRDLLRRFEARVRDALPGRVERVVAFGSRARGTSRPQSDLDIAVFLNGEVDQDVKDVVIDTGLDLSGDDDSPIVIATVLEAGRWNDDTPLVRAIRSDGVAA